MQLKEAYRIKSGLRGKDFEGVTDMEINVTQIVQDRIDNLQEEVAVLSEENKIVDEEFRRLGLSKNPQEN